MKPLFATDQFQHTSLTWMRHHDIQRITLTSMLRMFVLLQAFAAQHVRAAGGRLGRAAHIRPHPARGPGAVALQLPGVDGLRGDRRLRRRLFHQPAQQAAQQHRSRQGGGMACRAQAGAAGHNRGARRGAAGGQGLRAAGRHRKCSAGRGLQGGQRHGQQLQGPRCKDRGHRGPADRAVPLRPSRVREFVRFRCQSHLPSLWLPWREITAQTSLLFRWLCRRLAHALSPRAASR